MRLGLDVSQHQLSWPQIVERARFAEDAGFDGAWVFDHFTALYGDPNGPCLEGWTLLGALAAVTERIRLGTLVTGVTYRHPSILATQAVTIDHISNGRLELAVGASWHEGEHRRLGIDFPPAGVRVAMLDEAIRVMRALMTDDDPEFKGTHYRLEGGFNPKPVQRPHPPIWIGGHGSKMMALAARHADVWHTFGPVEDLQRRSAIVDRHAADAGRDPAAIVRSTALSLSQSMDDVRRDAAAKAAAGFSYLTVGWPSEGSARLDEFVARAMDEIRAL